MLGGASLGGGIGLFIIPVDLGDFAEKALMTYL